MIENIIFTTDSSREYSYLLLHPQIYSWSILREKLVEPIRLPEITMDLLRHGESVSNSQNLITGRTNVELTKNGRTQAKLAASNLNEFYDIAWHSSLRRSADTLKIALHNSSTKVNCIFKDDRLDERSLGVLENKKRREISAYAKGDLTYAPRGGESYLDLTRRCLSFLIDLATVAKYEDHPIKVLLSTHVGPMRVIWGILTKEMSSVNVLAKSFKNTHVERLILQSLSFPPFLQQELLYETKSTSSKLHALRRLRDFNKGFA